MPPSAHVRMQRVVRVGIRHEVDVCIHERNGGGQAPHVDVVHRFHTRNLEDACLQRPYADRLGNALHQNVVDVDQDGARGQQCQKRKQKCANRVGNLWTTCWFQIIE